MAADRIPGVTFVGETPDVAGEFSQAGILLASAPGEPLGLGVLEAMAAGVPVAAPRAGGFLETVGRLPRAPSFPPGDADAAAAALRLLSSDSLRAELSAEGRSLIARHFTVSRHVDGLIEQYEASLSARFGAEAHRHQGAVTTAPSPASGGEERLRELVVCSLEPWDEVWRRNQFLTAALLQRNAGLRVLFVEPAADVLFDLSRARRPTRPRLKPVRSVPGLHLLRPLKVLPRRLGAATDTLLLLQLRAAARRMGLTRPTLWVNDVTYAPLARSTAWPVVYDITDDWLLALSGRELVRHEHLERLVLDDADEVVVCSPDLYASRSRSGRSVTLVPNGVDVTHFRAPRRRPADLPPAPTALYVGTLHHARLDIGLVARARAFPTRTLRRACRSRRTGCVKSPRAAGQLERPPARIAPVCRCAGLPPACRYLDHAAPGDAVHREP